MRRQAGMILGLALALVPAGVRGENWPQFRGPGGTALSLEKPLPAEWAPDKNVLWKATIPGVAWSGPIVWGDKVFVTTAVTDKPDKPTGNPFGGGPPGAGRDPGQRPPRGGGGGPGGFGRGRNAKPPDVVYRWRVLCLDRATGKVVWDQLALEAKPRVAKNRSNTYATETPVTDGERVYAYFGMTGVFCFDVAGKLLWKKDLGAFPMQMGYGTASSPVVDDERLYMQCDNEQKSFLVALDKKTGEERWRGERDEKSSWSTPYLWKNKKQTELVALGGRKIRSYEPATGKVLWELSIGGGRCNATPVGDDDLLYVGAGAMFGGMGGFGGRGRFGGGEPGDAPNRPAPGGAEPGGMGRGGRAGGLFAVRAGASGDLTLKAGESSNAGVAWSQPRGGPSAASPVLYKGYLYILEQNGGMITCYDAKTGKTAYSRQRLAGARSFWASPWASDGKIYCLDGDGQTFIVQAGPQFKLLGKNALKEMTWATPAAADGAIFVRGVDHLFCIK